jgi:uncharacterized protein (DUF2062 family)
MMQWIKKKIDAYSSKNLGGKLPFFRSDSIPTHLFHFNRKSMAKGVAIGLFINFLPIPLQPVWALAFAIFCRANIPIAVSLTWINNPFTFIPITLFIYKIGSYFTDEELPSLALPTWEWHFDGFKAFWNEISTWFIALGKSYLIGLPIVSISAAVLGYLIVQGIWRVTLILKIHRKKRSKLPPNHL